MKEYLRKIEAYEGWCMFHRENPNFQRFQFNENRYDRPEIIALNRPIFPHFGILKILLKLNKVNTSSNNDKIINKMVTNILSDPTLTTLKNEIHSAMLALQNAPKNTGFAMFSGLFSTKDNLQDTLARINQIIEGIDLAKNQQQRYSHTKSARNNATV